jgi:hypothetical protein
VAGANQVGELVENVCDGRVVGVSDDDVMGDKPSLRVGQHLGGRQQVGITERPVPHRRHPVALVSGQPVDAGVARAIGGRKKGLAVTPKVFQRNFSLRES